MYAQIVSDAAGEFKAGADVPEVVAEKSEPGEVGRIGEPVREVVRDRPEPQQLHCLAQGVGVILFFWLVMAHTC